MFLLLVVPLELLKPSSHTQITVFYSHCENDTNSNERNEANYVASLKTSRTENGRESNITVC